MRNTGWIILSFLLLTLGAFVAGVYLAPSPKEMGMMELNGGKLKRAFHYYQAINKQGDNSINVLFPLTKLYVYYGHVDNAIALIETYVEMHPHSIEGRKKLAELYKDSQRFHSYCKTLEELQQLKPSTDYLRELADTYDFIGEYEKEMHALARLVEDKNYKPRGEDYVKLASLYRINNQSTQAINTINAYIDIRKYDVSMDIIRLSLQLLFEVDDDKQAYLIASTFLSKHGREEDAIAFSETFQEEGNYDDAYALLKPFLPNVEHSPALLQQLVNVQLTRGKKKELYALLSDMHDKSLLPDQFYATLIDISIDLRNYSLAESLLRTALLKEIPPDAMFRYANFALQVKRPDIATVIKSKLNKDYLQHAPLLVAVLDIAINDTPQSMGALLALPQNAITLPEQKMAVADIYMQHGYTKRAFSLFDTMQVADIVSALDTLDFVQVYLDSNAADKGRHILETAQQKKIFSRINMDNAMFFFAAGEGKTEAIQKWLKAHPKTDNAILTEANDIALRYHHNEVAVFIAQYHYQMYPSIKNKIQLANALIMDKRYMDALAYLQSDISEDAHTRSLYLDIISEIVDKTAASGVPEAYKKALGNFVTADLRRSSITYEERFNLVYLLEKADMKEQAETILFNLAANQPFNSHAVNELLGLWGDHLTPKALHWIESRALNASNTEKPIWLAYLNNTGNPRSVLTALHDMNNMPPAIADEYINALVAMHDPDQLAPALEKQIGQSTDASWVKKLANIAVQEDLAETADMGWRRLYALDPNNSTAIKEIGLTEYDAGHYAEAYKMIGRYLKDNDGNYQVNYAYADILEHRSEMDQAKKYYALAEQQVSRMKHKDIDLLMMEADLLYKVNHVDESLDLYRKLLSRHPENNALKANYADLLIETGKFDEASAVLSQQ